MRLPPRRGRDQFGPRYAVLVQTDELLGLSTVLVAPTSRSVRPATFRPEVVLAGERTRVMVEQLRALDIERLEGLRRPPRGRRAARRRRGPRCSPRPLKVGSPSAASKSPPSSTSAWRRRWRGLHLRSGVRIPLAGLAGYRSTSFLRLGDERVARATYTTARARAHRQGRRCVTSTEPADHSVATDNDGPAGSRCPDGDLRGIGRSRPPTRAQDERLLSPAIEQSIFRRYSQSPDPAAAGSAKRSRQVHPHHDIGFRRAHPPAKSRRRARPGAGHPGNRAAGPPSRVVKGNL